MNQVANTIMKANGAIRMPKLACRIPPRRTLTALGTAIGSLILSLGTVSYAQTNVTPAQYLASQPKPNFAPGHHLPHLTRWGWNLSSNACIELADNWGYALPLSNYATPGVASNTAVPGTFDYGMAQLAKNNPTKYKLSVLIDRTFPLPVPDGFWCQNAAGLFVDIYSNTWPHNIYTNGGWQCSTTNSGDWRSYHPWVSPESPDSYWATATAYWMNSLRIIQSNAPIAIILNGGEYGLNTLGWGMHAWQQDPRVQAQAVMTNTWTISNTNGMSWPRYTSDRKAHELGFLTAAIQQSLPNRELYIFYNTGDEQNRGYTPANLHWGDLYDSWGWKSDVLNANTDLPSFEDYYGNLGSWTNTGSDLLTKHLNAVGFDIDLGYKTNYSWVCGGWSTADTNALSDIPRYAGFLKCLYTAGMVGGIAGYFSYPPGTNGTLFGGPGFDAAFPSNSPPHWLQQIMALSHVHALFSQLETFIDNSDLISGPQHHAMSYDQPAYEFTNTVADATARVLARKLRGTNQWLICAWAADGINTNVTVTIPTLGALTVLAADSGSVYRVTMSGTNVQQTLLDEYSSYLLTICTNGPGTVTGAASGLYIWGTNITLTAQPSPYCHFVNWTGTGLSGSDTNAVLSFTMDQARTITANFAGSGVLGDVDSNGSVTAYDAALTARHAVGYTDADFKDAAAADVDGDGNITAYDAALIAQRAVGLISRFPVEQ